MTANIPMYLAADGLTTAIPLILSIEYVEITVPWDATSASVALTKGQNTANCVPFGSINTGNGWSYTRNMLFDIYFSAGSVVAERVQAISAETSSNVISVFVVEFNPLCVNVQQGTFTLNNGSSTTNASITAVDLNKAALVFSWKHAGTTLYPYSFLIRGRITSIDELTFDRGSTFTDASGHFFVFEAINSEFSVQAVTFTINSDSTFASINAVDLSKTILLGSFYSPSADNTKRLYTIGLFLGDSSTINQISYSASTKPRVVSAFVVSFAKGVAVQRGSLTWGYDDLTQSVALGTAIDKTKAIVNPIQPEGFYWLNSTDYNLPMSIVAKLSFNGDGAEVHGARTKEVGFASDPGTTYFEVVEFDF